ncbi:uncharacterized protein MELLADRAFT_112416 [Melampsora larici-populina 98AG31]|uniref:Ubiquilin n=1 Tax=Melampsora larici-populina (strain 98AG31 / pathotype 3-4-7) TaxID=747676 RepID=F4S6E6_MELLP|nr:uncharacterized protein MELLADRAFT_112416 [Melampsora larici-populina 98AG31]EGF99794.1 hypothetical protein MELLADRAFT_112416 [Melampsora larici-populina 98AG31]
MASESNPASNQETSTSDPTSASDTISLNIKAPGDSKLSLSISTSKTVLDLKKLISEITDPKVLPESQRLIYSGRVLKDESILSEYKIQSGHSIHMVKGSPKPQTSSSSTQQIPTNLNAGQQISGNPLAPLLNATNQIPAFNPFADMGINHNDPNMAMNMMDNPQVIQSITRMLEDPAVVDQMIASDPRLRSMGPQVREMMRSPFFRQLITNPDMMREMQGMVGNSGGMGNMMGFPGMPGMGAPAGGAGTTPGVNPIAAALGAQAGAGAQTGTTPGATTTPGSNNDTAAAGLGGMDPFAFMNTPLGQMAMQQMAAGGGGGGMPGMTGMPGMFGGLGLPPSQPADSRPPEERFEVQLTQLQGMGFSDARQNIRALQASGGNVEAAIEYILGGN